MRIALISDIHSNLEALTEVLKDIEKESIDKIYCLGDIVGYGPNPNECVTLVRDNCEITVMGNHDAAAFSPSMAKEFNKNAKYAIEWTASVLNDESRDFLSSLKLQDKVDDITLVHATPYDPYLWHYISTIEDARFNFNFFKTKFCFIGHTHISGLIMFNTIGNNITIHKPNSFDLSEYSENKFIVNTGSVGQPRDKNPKSSYVIFDKEEELITFKRIPYDIKKYQKKMKEIPMPDFLTSRVEIGK